MLTGSERNIVSEEDPEIVNRDGARHVDASSGGPQGGGGGEDNK